MLWALAVLWLHLLGAGIFLLLQPRGFEVGSAPFFAHQVLPAALFVAALAAAIGVLAHRPTGLSGVAVLAGFWVAIAGVAVVVGNTAFVVVIVAASLAMLAVLVGVVRAAGRLGTRLTYAAGGGPLGIALGIGFVLASWSPVATTRPAGGEPPALTDDDEPGPVTIGQLEARAASDEIVVRAGSDALTVRPAMHIVSASTSGWWTLLDFHSTQLPAWSVQRAGGGLVLTADTAGLSGRVMVSMVDGGVRIRSWTTVEREVHAHLASAVEIDVPVGGVEINGRHWHPVAAVGRGEFVAFRNGRLALLRTAMAEKGPFETIATWEAADPTVQAGRWQIEVRGWAAQVSRAPSPTAGWGVSQGAIEYIGSTLFWSVASTSVGRGWDTVATAPGTYVFDILIRRQ